jgi:hypothetical protein
MQSTKRKKPQHFLDYRLETYLIKNANCVVKVAYFLWSFEQKKQVKILTFAKFTTTTKKKTIVVNKIINKNVWNMKQLVLWMVKANFWNDLQRKLPWKCKIFQNEIVIGSF